MSPTTESHGTLIDVLYETAIAGAMGATVIWLLFLFIDAVTAWPLYTPTLLGSTIFLGADPGTVTSPQLGPVVTYTILHLVVFVFLGFIGAMLVRTMEANVRRPLWVALVLFGLLEGVFLLGTRTAAPELAGSLRYPRLAFINLVTAVIMVVALHRVRRGEEAFYQAAAPEEKSPAT